MGPQAPLHLGPRGPYNKGLGALIQGGRALVLIRAGALIKGGPAYYTRGPRALQVLYSKGPWGPLL